jgi:xanthine dehydrogenase accessory factor
VVWAKRAAKNSPLGDSVHQAPVVVVKGAGDLATGVIARLWRSGFRVVATEIARPTTVRRTVAFSEAVFTGETVVEGLRARLVAGRESIEQAWRDAVIPILVDPEAAIVRALRPEVVVDAIMAKRNLGTRIDEAPVVIGLGPGFTAQVDVHAVVETQRGHSLGRALWEGSAEPDTGIPGEIGGRSVERLLRAPCAGTLRLADKRIGGRIAAGEAACFVDQTPVPAAIDGMLRGLLHEGLEVREKMKIGDIDPRGAREHCFTISDKALAIGGGVLEAVLQRLHELHPPAHGA